MGNQLSRSAGCGAKHEVEVSLIALEHSEAREHF